MIKYKMIFLNLLYQNFAVTRGCFGFQVSRIFFRMQGFNVIIKMAESKNVNI